ncbi:hypothetical protein Tco_1366140, partial [Tanacetum coccineum]
EEGVSSRLVKVSSFDGVLDGAFGGVGDEEVVEGEAVVVASSSLEMLTNSYLGGIMVSLIFLEGLEEEALVEFMIEKMNEKEDAIGLMFEVINSILDEMRDVEGCIGGNAKEHIGFTCRQ